MTATTEPSAALWFPKFDTYQDSASQPSHQASASAMALPQVTTAPPPLRWLRLGRSDRDRQGQQKG